MRRTLSLVLVAAVLASALAGCLSAPTEGATTSAASLPQFDLNKTVVERLVLKVKDGTNLVLAVNMSEEARAAGAKLPVIVDIGPYFGTSIMTYTAIDKRLADYFVPRGYAVARASLRGTGESEGCFDIGGKAEQQDVVEIVNFLGEQEWSNGNVAVFGKSYDGTTPWMAAINHAPHLKTIVPISGISDMYRYTFYDGTAYPEELLFEPYYYLSVGEDISIPGPDGGDPAWDGNEGTLKNSINSCHAQAFSEQTRADVQSTITGDHGDPFWIERDYEPRFKDIEVPVFLVHGLQDWNVKPDHEIPMWDQLDVPKAAWLGQWAHDYPDINRHNADWSRHDWNETLLVWFDHWLKDVDNDWQSLAHVEAQDQAGTWTTYATWPPTDAVPVALSPRNDKTLSGTPQGAAVVTLHDPTGAGFDPKTKTGGAAFLTEPFPANVTLLGRPFVDLHLTTDRPGGNVVAKLYDVAPDGTWTELDHGMRELRHAKTRETSEPAPIGTRFNTTVWLYPQEMVIAQGHALALVLALEAPDWIVRSPFLASTTSVHLGDGATTLHLLARADGADAMRALLDAKPTSEQRATGALPRAHEIVK